jgi:hypothetical protein
MNHKNIASLDDVLKASERALSVEEFADSVK